jgi:DNA-binding transcriptional regulator YiaG
MALMPNFAVSLKGEISRVARKELRAETRPLKEATRACRTEIAALKRRTEVLESQVRRLSKVITKAAVVTSQTPTSPRPRFSAKGLASQRRRLGLSAHDCGLLIGTSGQSVYNWEDGKALPRTKYLTAIASLRSIGKKEALARLATLRMTS